MTQHFHGPHGQDLFRFGVEISRERNFDFPDWGVIVDKAGVRPTTNRDHGSREAKRRLGRGSQTSTPDSQRLTVSENDPSEAGPCARLALPSSTMLLQPETRDRRQRKRMWLRSGARWKCVTG